MPIIQKKFGNIKKLLTKSDLQLTAAVTTPAVLDGMYNTIMNSLYVPDKIINVHSVTAPTMIGLFTAVTVYYTVEDF